MPGKDVSRALAADASRVGDELLAIAEDQWFERKSGRIEPRRLAEALVGFAKADGGVIAVGLHNGAVDGTRAAARRRNELMQTAMTFTEPAVQAKATLYACVNARGQADDILVFEILTGSTVHATTRDDVYLRVGDETRKLTFSQRRELIYDKGPSRVRS